MIEKIAPYPIGDNGIKFDFGGETHSITAIVWPSAVEFHNGRDHEIVLIREIKLHFYSLDHLTKPIKVEGYNNGEEFVPADIVVPFYNSGIPDDKKAFCLNRFVERLEKGIITLEQAKLLYSWHFAIGFKEGEYIEKN